MRHLTALAATDPSPLVELGQELLSFGETVSVGLIVLALVLGVKLWEAIVGQLARWRFGVAATLVRWLPPTRLLLAALALLAIVSVVTPAEPAARAVVIAGVLVTVLWSAREVLRNLAAGAVIIAGQAVRTGDYVQVGPHAGRVRSVTLRGLELEQPDGSHTWVPGVLLHTDVAHRAPGRGGAAPVVVTARPHTATALARPEALVDLVRRLAMLSPRRAPGTPVLVSWDEQAALVHITVTPYTVAESEALRHELQRRLREAERGVARAAPDPHAPDEPS